MKVFMTDISTIKESEYCILKNSVTTQRLQKASKYKFRADATRCICGEILLRYAFYKCNIKPDIFEWKFNEYGKPYINDCKSLHFNISHSGKWVVVAISEDEIGVDIEEVVNDYSSVVYNYFSEKEKKYVVTGNLKKKNERITQLWTIKESYMKYRGKGLFMGMNSFSIDIRPNCICIEGEEKSDFNIYSKSIGQEYYMSLCGKGVLTSIKELGIEELLSFAEKNNLNK